LVGGAGEAGHDGPVAGGCDALLRGCVAQVVEARDADGVGKRRAGKSNREDGEKFCLCLSRLLFVDTERLPLSWRICHEGAGCGGGNDLRQWS